MVDEYVWGINPFQDFLFNMLLGDVDIVEEEVDVFIGFTTILEYFKLDKKYERYLDYEIKKHDICFKVIGKNALTALWLSGIYPENPEDIIDNNEFQVGDRVYKFNDKTKRLTYKIVKKNG